ncbi:MAG: hypothetical protein CVU56_24590 [Deltaproteobacteria bacterium HGW-Deltaproteobacteria-14]|nr:MAG: hypothetical protein CVU56_24590 [Deltaproteobacteria bacterium HGW-Deltaproteobacteria-14]
MRGGARGRPPRGPRGPGRRGVPRAGRYAHGAVGPRVLPRGVLLAPHRGGGRAAAGLHRHQRGGAGSLQGPGRAAGAPGASVDAGVGAVRRGV